MFLVTKIKFGALTPPPLYTCMHDVRFPLDGKLEHADQANRSTSNFISTADPNLIVSYKQVDKHKNDCV